MQFLQDVEKLLVCYITQIFAVGHFIHVVQCHKQYLTRFNFRPACANSSMGYLEDELDRVKEENRVQHEQILALQAQLQDTEDKLRKVSLYIQFINLVFLLTPHVMQLLLENEEANGLLQITKENQGSLAVELSEFKARYYEVQALLQDAQEQIRKLRKKQMPGARISMFSALGATGAGQFDSLQNELEMSMHSEFSIDSGISNTSDVM